MPLLVCMLCLLYGSMTWGAYKLQNLSVTNACPFIHSDNEVARLLDTLEIHLRDKISGNARCNATFNALNSSLKSVKDIFDNSKNY